MSWRGWLPKTLRDAVVPRLRATATETAVLPPWQASGAVALTSHRFEHAGEPHRLQVREHADGSGLVVVDAQRLARVDAAGLARLRAFVAAGGRGADALEAELWGEPVLTGRGAPRAANAWEPLTRGTQAVPDVPIVATVELGASEAGVARERVRRLHELAIPHVLFRPAGSDAAAIVIDAVGAAEDLGLVAGVAASADLLDDGSVLDELAQAGLDHLALTIAGATEDEHDAILGAGQLGKLRALAARAASLEVPLTGEMPLLDPGWIRAGATLAEASRLGMLGVTAWALVGSCRGAIAPQALRQVATTLEAAADTSPVRVTWAAPARCDAVGAAVAAGPRTDGDFGVRVLRDGSLLPPRGSTEPAGHLDRSSWDSVRSSRSWTAFREQASRPTRCAECPGLALCAVDCPADPEGWA